jgi:hypothetical protein
MRERVFASGLFLFEWFLHVDPEKYDFIKTKYEIKNNA